MRASLYSPLPGSRWFPPLLAAAGVVVLVSYLAGGARGIGLDQRVAAHSPGGRERVQIAGSRLDTPFAVRWLPSSGVARTAIAVALGRKSAIRDFGAVAAATACVMFGAWLYQRSLPIFPILLATLGIGFGATFWGRGVAWSIDALAPVMAIAGAFLGGRWIDGDRRLAIGAAGLCALAVAVLEDPTWLGGVPAAAWLVAASGKCRPSWMAGGAILLAGAAGIGVFLRLDALANAPWAAAIDVPVPSLASTWVMHLREGGVSPAALLAAEFTSLGSLLVLIAFGLSWQSAPSRAIVVVLVCGLVASRYLIPQVDPARAGVPIAVCGWAAIASALAWLAGGGITRHGRQSLSAATIVGVIGAAVVAQPALTRMRMFDRHEGAQAYIDAHTAARLRWDDFPHDAALISTSRLVDASIELAAGIRNARALIVPQTVTQAQTLVNLARQPVLAFPTAQQHLARLGFLFERAFVSNSPFGVLVGRQPCTVLAPGEWVDVTRQLDGRAFSLRSEPPPPPPGQVALYIAAPRAVEFADREQPAMPFQAAPAALDTEAEVRARMAIVAGRALGERTPITLWAIGPVSEAIDTAVTLSESPQAAIAMSSVSTPVSLCSAAPRTDFALGTAATAATAAPMNSASVFGVGWHTPESDGVVFRWTAEPEASIRVHVARPGPARVTIVAAPAAAARAQPRVGLQVNDCTLADHPMPQGTSDFVWNVRRDCWYAGANQLWLRTTPLVSPALFGGGPDTRLLGARVTAVRVERAEPR